MSDNVNHPKHYNSHPSGIECIEITENLESNLANAIKYLWRGPDKGNYIEDVKKAQWYINREFNRVKGLSLLGKILYKLRNVTRRDILKGKLIIITAHINEEARINALESIYAACYSNMVIESYLKDAEWWVDELRLALEDKQ